MVPPQRMLQIKLLSLSRTLTRAHPLDIFLSLPIDLTLSTTQPPTRLTNPTQLSLQMRKLLFRSLDIDPTSRPHKAIWICISIPYILSRSLRVRDSIDRASCILYWLFRKVCWRFGMRGGRKFLRHGASAASSPVSAGRSVMTTRTSGVDSLSLVKDAGRRNRKKKHDYI